MLKDTETFPDSTYQEKHTPNPDFSGFAINKKEMPRS